MKFSLQKNFFLLLFLFPLVLPVWAQPANNAFENAVELIVGENSGEYITTGTTVGATNSNKGGTPSCGTGLNSDVWYKVEVPDSGNIALETFNVSGDNFKSVLTVYTQDTETEALTEVGCADDGGSYFLSKIVIIEQVPKSMLYVRVWGKYQAEKPFKISAWVPDIPVNNDVAGAIELTVGQDRASAMKTPGSTEFATNSNQGGTPSCGSGLASDVWYKVVVPNSGNIIIETFNVGDTFFNSVLTVYKGTEGNLTQIYCDDDSGFAYLSKLVLSEQAPNTLLYIRVWGDSGGGDQNPFEISAWDATPPVNNDVANAVTLTVGATSNEHKAAGTTIDATNSNQGGTPSCGSGLASDVWYKVAVPNSGNIIIETFNVGDTFFNSVLTVYKGTEGNLTQIHCDDNSGSSLLSKMVLSEQTPNTLLYIRVWGSGGDQKPFEISAWDTTPNNNDFASATPLTVGATSDEHKTAGSTVGATNSNQGGTPSCGTGLNSDVWYTSVVPISGNIAIETFDIDSFSFDSVLSVYIQDTTSSTLVEVSCNKDTSSSSSLSKIVLLGQTSGTTLYIRVWGNSGEQKPFEISAWDPAIPSNNDIADAIELVVGESLVSDIIEGSTVNATNSHQGITPLCGSGLSSDVWYKVVVPSSGNVFIETFDVNGYSFDSVLTVYKGPLDSLTEVGCANEGGSDANLSKIELSGQTLGTTLYIRVWGNNGEQKPFKISAWESSIPANNDIANAEVLTVGTTSDTKTGGSTVSATNSNQGGLPLCGWGLKADVWYTAEVPNSGNIAIEIFNIGNYHFNSVLTVYSGIKDSLTEVSCTSSEDNNGLSKVVLTDQTPKTTLYIRIWGNNYSKGSFEVSAWDETTLSNIALNEQRFVLHPNPTAEQLYIQSPKKVSSVKVYNLTGAMVLSTTIAEDQVVDVRKLVPGIYLAQLEHKNGNTYQKFIKE